MSTTRNVAIIGVGLIGGSIGLALHKRGLAECVTGFGRRQESLEKALAVGAIDRATTDPKDALQEADLVIVATPVASVVEDILRADQLAPRASWITDVGSTKGEICQATDKSLKGRPNRFVGSHPLAGDHRTGPENARPDLFEGRTVVITPTPATNTNTIQLACEFWASLGAVVRSMDPAEHDRALAATSHLPHLVASALASVTPEEYLPLAATGWGDTTRIAASDPDLWVQIFAQNSNSVIEQLDRLIDRLNQLRGALDSGSTESLRNTLQRAKEIRNALGN